MGALVTALITHERQASADNENMHRLPSLARSRLQRQKMIKSAKIESVAVTVELGSQRQGLLVLAVDARTQKSVHPCQRLVHARVPFRPTLLCCLLGRRDHPPGAAAAGLHPITHRRVTGAAACLAGPCRPFPTVPRLETSSNTRTSLCHQRALTTLAAPRTPSHPRFGARCHAGTCNSTILTPRAWRDNLEPCSPHALQSSAELRLEISNYRFSCACFRRARSPLRRPWPPILLGLLPAPEPPAAPSSCGGLITG